MKNSRQKGNYYANKTKALFEKMGYQVVKAEITKIAWINGRPAIPIHTDIWYSDLIAMNRDEIIFIQVKLGDKNISAAKKAFDSMTWAKNVKRYVVQWKPKIKKPIIWSYDEDLPTQMSPMWKDISQQISWV